MSLPRYQDYRPSGVEWLGAIPSHWSVSQSRRMFKVRSEPALPDDQMLTASQKYGVLPQAEFMLREGRRVVEVIQGVESLKHVEPDDFIISMRSFQGGIEWCRLRGSTSFHYVMLTPVKWVWPPFFAYALKSAPYIQALRRTTDLIRDGQELRFSNFAQVPLPLVPVDEQKAIAGFLDRETAKVDSLIDAQEKLIELLAEKRRATISHAVARGLNPHAPMKPSGVTWLGDVPAHWEVRPLKHLGRIGNGSTPNRENPAYWAEKGFPWLNSSVVNQDEVTEAEQYVTDKALEECHLPVIQPPAVLVGITGQGKTRGMATQLQFTATVNQHLAYIKPDTERLSVAYLLWSLSAAYDTLRTESEGAGSTKGAITCEQLGRFRIPVPRLNEQYEIARFLEFEAGKLDSLQADAERAISLLKERRSALIAAAVTGKIDVRCWHSQPRRSQQRQTEESL